MSRGSPVISKSSGYCAVSHSHESWVWNSVAFLMERGDLVQIPYHTIVTVGIGIPLPHILFAVKTELSTWPEKSREGKINPSTAHLWSLVNLLKGQACISMNILLLQYKFSQKKIICSFNYWTWYLGWFRWLQFIFGNLYFYKGLPVSSSIWKSDRLIASRAICLINHWSLKE